MYGKVRESKGGFNVAKVSKKGQIFFPVDWIKKLGGLKEGELLFLHVDENNHKIWISKTRLHDKVITAPLLSENQLTIPVKIRDLFEIEAGDTIEFGYSDDQKYVYFKKKLDTYKCPICTGTGNIENHKCAVCRETGVIEVEKFQDQFLRLFEQSRVYGIAVNYSWDDFEPTTGEITPRLYPQVRMFSKEYPQHLLDRMQDYYQLRIIEEFSPNSISDIKLFQTPSDVLLNEILTLVKTEDAKKEIRSWFRGKKSVFASALEEMK